MIPAVALWPCLAFLLFLCMGCIAARKDFTAAGWLRKIIVLGPVFVAASLAAFGAEHLAGANFVAAAVPAWMPAPLFWVYLVGVALLAAALSLSLNRYVRWSAAALALMIFLFVLMIHIPGVIRKPGDRIFWIVMLRDLSFAAGAAALFAMQIRPTRPQLASGLMTFARVAIAVAVIFFGVEYMLHPQSAPGVPLEKLTPAWVPFPVLWGYLTGVILLVLGAAMLMNRRSRSAAVAAGIVMAFYTVFLYVPILVLDPPGQMLEGINYVADTLFYSGTALLLAGAFVDRS